MPQSEYTDDVKNSYANYNGAAIVVLSRSSGEGAGHARNMDRFGGSSDEHYLELSQNEKDLLKAVNDAGFKKVIVLLHSANPMQMDFLKQYNVQRRYLGARHGNRYGRHKMPCANSSRATPSFRVSS